MKNIPHGVVVLDFGSQFTQLIARRIRELGVFSEILRFDTPIEEIKKRKPVGLVLSGGPSSVYDADSPQRKDIKDLLEVAPVLGICYGMQILAHELGGKVEKAQIREYGRMQILWELGKADNTSYRTGEHTVWMSHGDLVLELPKGSKGLAKSQSGHWAAMEGERFVGLQFHPEVSHTQDGKEIIKDFIFKNCKAKVNWHGRQLVEYLIEEIRSKVGNTDEVVCGISGGVDSTVTAALLSKALGPDRVHNVFVDTGLLRHGEGGEVMTAYDAMKLKVTCVDASDIFLKELEGVEDPEKKRKIIGRVFIEVFEKQTRNLPVRWLAQGTLYPDVIESVSIRGKSVTIKSHHNVGGLPEKMKLKLVEPLRELFKDEVRALGLELGVPSELLHRHPFPGPGLAVRIIGPITEEDLGILRLADHVFIDELRKSNLYSEIWQAFVVLLSVKTVGVMGDARTYERVAALRAVTSLDGMTADWYGFESSFLARVSNRITNEVKGINRVVYDISSKPPATIEWE